MSDVFEKDMGEGRILRAVPNPYMQKVISVTIGSKTDLYRQYIGGVGEGTWAVYHKNDSPLDLGFNSLEEAALYLYHRWAFTQ